MTSRQDVVNRRTWSKPSSLAYFDRRVGFLPGEKVPFDFVSERLYGRPVLELGVGIGRTIEFTSSLSAEYRAIDYVPAMVDAARARHPNVRIDLGDARSLDGVPDGHFGLVTFAWNGIDAVSHRDRARVLRSVRRVLAPDGMFFFSTLNLDGPDPRERPWKVELGSFEPSRNPWVLGLRAAWIARHFAKNVVNWMRLLPSTEHGPGYRVAPLAAHEFGVLVHYTTLARQLEELDDAGFGLDVRVFASHTGAPVKLGDDTRDVEYFHLVATA